MAQETVGGAQQWQQTYGYDNFGNRWVTGYTPGTATPSASSNYGTAGAGRNQLSGVTYDLAGNQQQMAGIALQYDGENRQIASTVNGVTTNYLYDGEGRRVQTTTGAAATVYVHDATGNEVAEYSTQTPAVGGTEYVMADHLGSTRLVTNASGTAVACHDYLPFGEELLAPESGRSGCYGSVDGVTQKFTGKERDAETAGSATPSGLDYFGARYFSGALGRFTSPDLSMRSASLGNPQTWDRYAYSLNNPLRYIDPTGELWMAAQNDTYSWVDQCGGSETCYQAVAAVSGSNLTIYGSANSGDITAYAANDKGYIDLNDIADHPDAYFEVKDGANSYLSLSHAANFFNTAEQYHEDYPNDSNLVVTDAGKANGAGFSPHKTHDLGRAVDLRYMDANGDPVRSDSNRAASDKADVDRTSDLVDVAKQNGFNQDYSARPKDFGTSYAAGHDTHLHLGATRPVKQKIKPPSQ